MLPVVALVGQPNVGKSTLFNVLTRSRDALVADYPGLTRDRRYGRVQTGERAFFVVDTGGIVESADGIEEEAMRQVDHALRESDLILLIVDARAGLSAADETIAARLRRTGKPLLLVANKTDGLRRAETALAEFHTLGLGEPQPIAAAHGSGIGSLIATLLERLPAADDSETEPSEASGIRVAVVGRPNVGKSTLVNRILGEDRVVVYDQPGTTRDSIYVPFEKDGQRYVLIDTAGIRRRAKVFEAIEKFSVIKAFQAVEDSHVVIYLIDASEGVTDQDASLLGMVLEIGRGLIIGLNKWDGLSIDQRDQVRRQIDIKLAFIDFAETRYLSALHGTGVGHLLDSVDDIYQSVSAEFSTSKLTQVLQDALTAHQPPLVRGRRIRLKMAHMGGRMPPSIVIHGNQTDELPGAYKRYLANTFRKALGVRGIPIKLEFRSSDNPFKGRRNELSERQVRKRRRLMRFVKKK
ncbi:MAG: ribosome biogenesis GTPase Der [Methylotetracoccus sp.]